MEHWGWPSQPLFSILPAMLQVLKGLLRVSYQPSSEWIFHSLILKQIKKAAFQSEC